MNEKEVVGALRVLAKFFKELDQSDDGFGFKKDEVNYEELIDSAKDFLKTCRNENQFIFVKGVIGFYESNNYLTASQERNLRNTISIN